MDGPAFVRAATHTPMNVIDVPMTSTCPDPYPTHTDGLEGRSDTADQQDRKDAPRDIAFGLPSDPGYDDHGQRHRRHDDRRPLHPRPKCY